MQIFQAALLSALAAVAAAQQPLLIPSLPPALSAEYNSLLQLYTQAGTTNTELRSSVISRIEHLSGADVEATTISGGAMPTGAAAGGATATTTTTTPQASGGSTPTAQSASQTPAASSPTSGAASNASGGSSSSQGAAPTNVAQAGGWLGAAGLAVAALL